MAIEILHTTNGPIIRNGNTTLTMSDMNDLLELFIEDNLIPMQLRDAILVGYVDASNEFGSKFREGSMFAPEKLMAYINAMRQWIEVVLIALPQYRKALEDAQNA